LLFSYYLHVYIQFQGLKVIFVDEDIILEWQMVGCRFDLNNNRFIYTNNRVDTHLWHNPLNLYNVFNTQVMGEEINVGQSYCRKGKCVIFVAQSILIPKKNLNLKFTKTTQMFDQNRYS
jgi:hypothetical protein